MKRTIDDLIKTFIHQGKDRLNKKLSLLQRAETSEQFIKMVGVRNAVQEFLAIDKRMSAQYRNFKDSESLSDFIFSNFSSIKGVSDITLLYYINWICNQFDIPIDASCYSLPYIKGVSDKFKMKPMELRKRIESIEPEAKKLSALEFSYFIIKEGKTIKSI